MSETPLEFIGMWNTWARILALASIAFGIVSFLRYWVRMAASKDPKAKYDLINTSEITALRSGSVFVIIALALIANSFLGEIGLFWLLIRGFVTISLSVIIGVILQNVLKFYYPFSVEKRLKKLRYKPRISPKTTD